MKVRVPAGKPFFYGDRMRVSGEELDVSDSAGAWMIAAGLALPGEPETDLGGSDDGGS
ncbi:hypothetical protein GCM10023079_30900 [Streptomyces chitinivorans]